MAHDLRIKHELVVKQLPSGEWGIGKVQARRGNRVAAWSWIRNLQTGEPLSYSRGWAIKKKRAFEVETREEWARIGIK